MIELFKRAVAYRRRAYIMQMVAEHGGAVQRSMDLLEKYYPLKNTSESLGSSTVAVGSRWLGGCV